MVIECNIGTLTFEKKPPNARRGSVRTDIGSLARVKKLTPEELIAFIEEGRPFNAGVVAGTMARDWQKQQLIAIDIDNQTQEDDPNDPTGKKKIKKPLPKEEQLTPEEALEILQEYGLAPYFMYNTFSNSDAWRRYRLVFVLDEVIEDPATPPALQSRLIDLFLARKPKSTDAGTIDLNRIFFGSYKGSVFFKSGTITKLSDLWNLPKSEEEEKEEIRAQETEERKKRLAEMPKSLEEMRQRLRDEINSFDMIKFLKGKGYKIYKQGSNTFVDPCPICGHYHDFHVRDLSPWRWKCEGGATPKDAQGTIIDFLMWEGSGDSGKPVRSLGEALKIFKYELLGWDEKEEKKKYAKAMEEAEIKKMNDNLKNKGIGNTNALSDPATETTSKDLGEQAEGEPAQEEPKTYGEKLEEFFAGIQTEQYKPVQTGIDSIDKALDGGFIRKTLVTLGAAPGMGKTALAQWLFEGMAENGHEVLYINLEMARDQLIARSLSRMIFEKMGEDMSPLEIMRGYRWDEQTKATVEKAWETYQENIASRFQYNPTESSYLGEGGGVNFPARESGILPTLRRIAEEKTAQGKPAPIVCVDYLQIVRTDQKDEVAGIKAVLDELKAFAIKYNTIVFLILANNRASNKEGRSEVDSSRDTSAIEYSGDIMLGLTYTAIEDEYKAFVDKIDEKLKVCNPRDKAELDRIKMHIPTTGSGDKERNVWEECTLSHLRQIKKQAYDEGAEVPEICRKVSLKIVKNRFGSSERRVHLIFDGKHSSFSEEEGFSKVAIAPKAMPWKTGEGAPYTFGRKKAKKTEK